MRWTYLYLFALFSLVVCVAGLPTPFIKTKQLRNRKYRKDAITQHTIHSPGYTPTRGDHADHLLELQQVTGWLNKHHQTPSGPCLAALKQELNGNNNLAMVRGKTNIQKGRKVNGWLAGKQGPAFSSDARQHVDQHSRQILTVARAVDRILSGTCGLAGIGRPIEEQSKRLYNLP